MARNGGGEATPSPDEAFAVLGNETRVRILRTLGEAGEPLAFTELRDRLGIRQGGQFNYHLNKLVGHFVGKTEDGYTLRHPGRRVVEAVLSGTVTDDPVLEPTRIDESCHWCDAPMFVSFSQGRVGTYCLECTGKYGESTRPAASRELVGSADYGYLGYLELPPAGVEGRTATEMYRAAWTWANLGILAEASGVCPRCSATLDRSVRVCEAHDATDGLCGRCDHRHAVRVAVRCTNCILDKEVPLGHCLLAHTDLLAFLTAHGLNPVSPASTARVNRVHDDYEEEVRSTEPFEARFTFAADGDSITLTVDGDLNVVAVEGWRPDPAGRRDA